MLTIAIEVSIGGIGIEVSIGRKLEKRSTGLRLMVTNSPNLRSLSPSLPCSPYLLRFNILPKSVILEEIFSRLTENVMTQPHLLELAKQGEPRAISALLNQHLKYQGIRSKVALKDSCLHVLLESEEQVPDRYQMVDFVRVKLVNLESETIARAIVYGRQQGQEKPAWNQEFALAVGGYSHLVSSQSYSIPPTLAQDETQTSDFGSTNSPEPDSPPSAQKSTPDRKCGPMALAAIVSALLVAIALAYLALNSDSPSETVPTPQSQQPSPVPSF